MVTLLFDSMRRSLKQEQQVKCRHYPRHPQTKTAVHTRKQQRGDDCIHVHWAPTSRQVSPYSGSQPMTAKKHHQDPNLTVIIHKDAYQQNRCKPYSVPLLISLPCTYHLVAKPYQRYTVVREFVASCQSIL